MKEWLLANLNTVLGVVAGTVVLGGFSSWMLLSEQDNELRSTPAEAVVVAATPKVSTNVAVLEPVKNATEAPPTDLAVKIESPVNLEARKPIAPATPGVPPRALPVASPSGLPAPGVEVQDIAAPVETVTASVTTRAAKPAPAGLDPSLDRDAAIDLAKRVLPQSADQPSALKTPEAVDPNAPVFDLVRVETDGSALVAGRAEPRSRVEIMLDGDVVSVVDANARGEFVAMLQAETKSGAGNLTLKTTSDGAKVNVSPQSVLILTNTSAEDLAPPALIRTTPKKVEILQPARPVRSETVTLDLITYSDSGDVVLAGLARPNADLRIYANDEHVTDVSVTPDGSWRVAVSKISRGRYSLRVDELDESRTSVSSRIETPFQRDYPVANLPVEAVTLAPTVIVQPGNSLWKIAETHLGGGARYSLIYSENRDRIRDPDLIYPGQIFDIPNKATE